MFMYLFGLMTVASIIFFCKLQIVVLVSKK